MKALDANSMDSIITDPPYGLEFMGQEWDKLGATVEVACNTAGGTEDAPGRGNAFSRARIRYGTTAAAMQAWHQAWAVEALRVAKPGAILLAFGGSRTHHRLMCGIEAAGWILRDCVMYVYGSGFPKSLDISKAIDKAAGAERKPGRRLDTDGSRGATPNAPANATCLDCGKPKWGHDYCLCPRDGGPATELAQQWHGWGTALKPAYEPILLCQKPLTAVPLHDIIVEVQHLIGGLLCLLLSNANNARGISELSPRVPGEVCVSALMLAAVLHGAESGEMSEAMDTYNSQAMAKTCLNIATLWSNILGEYCKQANMSIISMETELITALRTLSCLLSTNIPVEVIQAVSRPVGSMSHVNIAAEDLTNDEQNIGKQRATFAADLVSLHRSDIGILARNAINSLQAIVPSVVSVLSHALQHITTERGVRLSPNWEPIVLAMKPLDGTFAANSQKWGVAGLWIDGGRIPTAEPTPGRFPANLIHDGSDEVVGLFPQTGISRGGGGMKSPIWTDSTPETKQKDYGDHTGFGDSGSAARFFYTAKASGSDRGNRPANELPLFNETEPEFRNTHPTVKPVSLMEYLCRLTRTPTGGIVLDPFAGSGSTALAARAQGRPFVGIEMSEEYCAIAVERLKA
jgi:DNA modification methylase